MKWLSIITIIAIASTLICGLWMKFGPGVDDTNFHVMLSIGTLVLCLITIILYMVQAK